MNGDILNIKFGWMCTIISLTFAYVDHMYKDILMKINEVLPLYAGIISITTGLLGLGIAAYSLLLKRLEYKEKLKKIKDGES